MTAGEIAVIGDSVATPTKTPTTLYSAALVIVSILPLSPNLVMFLDDPHSKLRV